MLRWNISLDFQKIPNFQIIFPISNKKHELGRFIEIDQVDMLSVAFIQV